MSKLPNDQREIDEVYKQLRLNTRNVCLNIANDRRTTEAPIEEIIKDAKAMEEYLLEGIDAPKTSSIIKATTGPSH